MLLQCHPRYVEQVDETASNRVEFKPKRCQPVEFSTSCTSTHHAAISSIHLFNAATSAVEPQLVIGQPFLIASPHIAYLRPHVGYTGRTPSIMSSSSTIHDTQHCTITSSNAAEDLPCWVVAVDLCHQLRVVRGYHLWPCTVSITAISSISTVAITITVIKRTGSKHSCTMCT